MHWLLPSGYLPFFDLGLVHPHHLWKSPLVVLEGGGGGVVGEYFHFYSILHRNASKNKKCYSM